jgi:predicted AAA+ superfamily ATPase
VFNDSTVIIFEDKTGTQQHDDQLKRYKNILEGKLKGKQTSFVYIKSDIIWRDETKAAEDAEYYQIDL